MKNEFDNLPVRDEGARGVQGAGQNTAFISVSDIKDFISPKLYSELSWDENRSAEEVTEECIERACVLAETLLHLVDQELNLYSETQKMIVKNLCVYELYVYNGDKNKAKTFMEKAERLINGRYGSLESKREDGVPVCAVRVPD